MSHGSKMPKPWRRSVTRKEFVEQLQAENVVLFRPGAEEAHKAGQALLTEREKMIRRTRLRYRIQFWATLATLLLVAIIFAVGVWWVLSEQVPVR